MNLRKSAKTGPYNKLLSYKKIFWPVGAHPRVRPKSRADTWVRPYIMMNYFYERTDPHPLALVPGQNSFLTTHWPISWQLPLDVLS
jgi:hypothetical protein